MEEQAWWRSGSLLGGLTPQARGELLALGTNRAYPAGAVMIQQGSRDTHALVLLDGFAKITVASSDSEALLAIRVPGDIVGELAATSGRSRIATVTACGPVKARVIVADRIRYFLSRNPEAAAQFNAIVGDRLAAAHRRRVEFATQPLQTRLARVLVELATLCGTTAPDGSIHISFTLRQGELAGLVGASEDTVQRALRTLRRDGLLDTGYRSVVVRDVAQLRALSSEGRD